GESGTLGNSLYLGGHNYEAGSSYLYGVASPWGNSLYLGGHNYALGDYDQPDIADGSTATLYAYLYVDRRPYGWVPTSSTAPPARRSPSSSSPRSPRRTTPTAGRSAAPSAPAARGSSSARTASPSARSTTRPAEPLWPGSATGPTVFLWAPPSART